MRRSTVRIGKFPAHRENALTATEVLQELESLGSESVKRMLMKNHGVREPCFGVRIGDMKSIRKRVKQDYQLALDLYATGNHDAMYLAGLIADDSRMTREDLQNWVEGARGGALAGTTVASVAAGSAHGWAMALRWIDSKDERIAEAGWSVLANLAVLKDDSELDLPKWRTLIERVEKTIHDAPDRARYGMNGFLIAAGCCVKPLTPLALEAGERIGPVAADLGPNQCQIPFAPEYIRKVEARGALGKKRKTVKC
jgi:3-methyladenine DNA glycosylase AlkD